ncbi:hypothetical protein BOTBODRAFT_63931 [Botryobasidium botryosum FD-172 SS1]|uniref:Uncharacterized protein n=1 Tax=Botryobasidium botryosum (strain FD-172 SS1) TaxID=930990 RepID=A0A067MR93_BOTB1|nr:hypothetical protein BOTBODRAFT_63931 [Botryobasidium botryosum FD-172 SS1]
MKFTTPLIALFAIALIVNALPLPPLPGGLAGQSLGSPIDGALGKVGSGLSRTAIDVLAPTGVNVIGSAADQVLGDIGHAGDILSSAPLGLRAVSPVDAGLDEIFGIAKGVPGASALGLGERGLGPVDDVLGEVTGLVGGIGVLGSNSGLSVSDLGSAVSKVLREVDAGNRAPCKSIHDARAVDSVVDEALSSTGLKGSLAAPGGNALGSL